MTAFNRSPGGCCCVKGWFSTWRYITGGGFPPITRTNGQIVRSAPLVLAADGDLHFNSLEGADWAADAGFSVSAYWGANSFPANNPLVWLNIFGPANSPFSEALGLLDSSTKQLVFPAIPGEDPFNPYIQSLQSIISVDQSRVLGLANGGASPGMIGFFGLINTTPISYQFVTCDAAGNVVSVPAPKGNLHWNPPPPGVNITGSVCQGVAWRYWPRACGARTRYQQVIQQIGGSFSGFGPQQSAVYRGTVFVDDGAVQCTEDEVVMETVVPGKTLSWLCYDESDTHWAGIVAERDGDDASDNPWYIYHLFIDGVLIESDQFYTQTAFGLAQLLHVCHPHEALGDGWVAVCTLYYDVPPTKEQPNGVFENPSFTSRVRFFKDGVFRWETWRCAYSTTIASSDRWIYVVSPQTTTPQGGPDILPITSFHKHDGSQRITRAALDGNWPAGLNTTGWGPHAPNGFVINSAELPGTMPLNFPDDFQG